MSPPVILDSHLWLFGSYTGQCKGIWNIFQLNEILYINLHSHLHKNYLADAKKSSYETYFPFHIYCIADSDSKSKEPDFHPTIYHN